MAVAVGAQTGEVNAPMAGIIARVFVADGDAVLAGQPLCVLESLKLETVLAAKQAGRVRVCTQADANVVGGQILFTISD